VNTFFDHDGPFARIMGRAFDLLALSILWLLCAVPLVTVPAACVALHRAVRGLGATPAPSRAFLCDVGRLVPRLLPVGLTHLAAAALLGLDAVMLRRSPGASTLLTGCALTSAMLLALVLVSIAYLPLVVGDRPTAVAGQSAAAESVAGTVAASLYLAARFPVRTAGVVAAFAATLVVVSVAPPAGLAAPAALAWAVSRVVPDVGMLRVAP
jgi:hypothetical protein